MQFEECRAWDMVSLLIPHAKPLERPLGATSSMMDEARVEPLLQWALRHLHVAK